MDTLRRAPRPALAAATSLYLFFALSFGYWLTTSDSKDYGAWVIVCVAGSLIAAALLLWFVPRTEADVADNKPAKHGMVLGILSIVTVLGFWTGLPVVLGVPAVVLGAEGRARAASQGHGRQATAAVAMGVIAIVLVLVVSIIG